ncbi:hypothetical protein [Streptomyces kebangsaanensis]|uniref:hypothetical protein n=1 Tax=Streptomyces kebangsaanensis TaxID=864058 RepID=UPI00093D9198|nr:hypothetical protein [Streptomyces kebangsaanensis]
MSATGLTRPAQVSTARRRTVIDALRGYRAALAEGDEATAVATVAARLADFEGARSVLSESVRLVDLSGSA